jgi:hypothetical protein
MDNQSHNGNGNGKGHYNGYSGNGRNGNGHNENDKPLYPIVEVKRTIQPRTYARRRPSLLPLVFLCSVVGLGIVLVMTSTRPPKVTEEISKSDAFRWGVNRAMSAAELTQTARSAPEWQQVSDWWQEAIKLMQAVPKSDANYSTATAKIDEYQTNLAYAQTRLKSAVSQAGGADLWGIGSRRAMVLKLQGKPQEAERYDSICKEVLHYGRSQVELGNGFVTSYDDFDRNLKATSAILPTAVQAGRWDLGATKADVLKIQGTPSRIAEYGYADLETLHYGSSTVDLANERVVGYNNRAGILKVSTRPILPDGKATVWTPASSREAVLQVQGTPTQISLSPSTCTETFYYGNSTVTLRNGFIAGYDNLDGNLRVRAQ